MKSCIFILLIFSVSLTTNFAELNHGISYDYQKCVERDPHCAVFKKKVSVRFF